MIESAKKVFQKIYDVGIWSHGGTKDGDYSNVDHTQKLIDGLVPLLQKWKLKSIFDASCGEFWWTRHVPFAKNNIHYIGGEIVDAKIDILKRDFPTMDFRVFDIIEDKFPDVDVWMCKDTIIHFPIYYTQKTLRNFVSSNIKYCLISSYATRSPELENVDIPEFGQYSISHNCVPVNLTKAPFSFPEPLDILEYTNHPTIPPYATPEERLDIANVPARFFLFLYDRETVAKLPFLEASIPEPV